MAKLVDALDLGSSAARCKSSSLFAPTIERSKTMILLFLWLNLKGLIVYIEDWCNGSMTVSKTVRQGSSPWSSAKIQKAPITGAFFILVEEKIHKDHFKILDLSMFLNGTG